MSEHSRIENHTAVVNGLNFHYPKAGRAKETLVLLHGFPQHSRMWRNVIPALAEKFTVIAPDGRGMGGTSITPEGYDKRTMAEDLRSLLDHIGIENSINLVGYDLGGGTAYAFASLFPEKVKKLAFIEYAPPGYGYEYGMQPVRNWQAWQLAFFTVPDVAVQFITGRERELLAWYFWHWSYNPEAVSQEDFEHYVRQLQKPGALRAGFQWFASVFDDAEQVKEFAKKKLSMPVLALGGEKGANEFVLQGISRLAEDVQGGVIQQAGHWIADEQPAELAVRLLNFLEEANDSKS
jgi:pimeloyl-ACP methyl ester carboxylesterase